MIRRSLNIPFLAILLLAAAAGDLRHRSGVEALDHQLWVTQECSSHGVKVDFRWTGANPSAAQQWLDLSLFNNGWQWGTFLGAGPFSASAQSHSWDGIIPNAVHFVRLNQQLPNGQWQPSSTFYFQSADCAVSATPAAAAPAVNLWDMSGSHDGSPLGVPSSYSWQRGPEVQNARPPAGWQGMLGWGQAYSDAGQPVPPDNLRIEVRRLSVLALVGSQWEVLQDVQRLHGSYYSPTYSGTIIGAVERREAGGGFSVAPYAGHPYHFFPAERALVPGRLSGVAVVIEARLVLDEATGPDNRSNARIMLGAGLDWFAGTEGSTSTIGACVGRMTWLTSEYQTFACSTVAPGEIANNPPPIP